MSIATRPTFKLILNRARLLCEEWARLNSDAAELALLDNLCADESGANPFNAIAIGVGKDLEMANQRAGSLAQFLLKTDSVPEHVAMLITRPSTTAAVDQYTIAILSGSGAPVEVSNDGVPAGAAVPNVKVVVSSIPMKGDVVAAPTEDDLAAFFKVLSESVAAASPSSAIAVMEGEFAKHNQSSVFTTAIYNALTAGGSAIANLKVSKAVKLFTALLTPKYDDETGLAINRAAAMYTAVFKAYVATALDNAASSSTSVLKYDDFRQTSFNYINAANTLPGYDKLNDWRAFKSVIYPQVFNGGKTTLESNTIPWTAAITDAYTGENLHINSKTGVPLIVRLSVRNREQAALGSRTFFFKDSAPSNGGDALAFVAAAEAEVWKALNSGVENGAVTTFDTVYNKAMEAIKALPNADAFVPYLHKDFGTSMGPIMTDRRSVIEAGCSSLIRTNTSYFVRIALVDIPFPAADSSNTAKVSAYTVEVGDTVVAGTPVKFERRAPRTYPECLLLPDGDPARPSHGAHEGTATEAAIAERRAVTRKQENGGVDSIAAEEARIAKQAKLWEEKEREFGNAGPKPKTDDPLLELTTAGRLANGSLQSYSSRMQVQKTGLNLNPDRLFANADALTVWLPIAGRCVPFHMSTIKEINVRTDPSGNGGYVCTVLFHSTQESYVPFRTNRSKIFIRELTYKGDSSAMFDAVRNAVIIGHETVKDADKKRQSEKGLLPSSNLGIRTGTVIGRIPGIFIRPQVYAKVNNRGNFEATDKGFRFDFTGGGLSPIEISYDNVHYCICQPANSTDIHVIFHVVLFKPVQWGKEKAGIKEFQIAATVQEASVGVGSHKLTEAQEMAKEEEDRKLINNTNKEFIDFSRALSGSGKVKNIFIPNKSFDIDGSMGKGNVRIRGSPKALWQITETPFQSVIFSDIEIALLERMIIGGKTFDLVLVPKNYRNKVVTISSIPMKKAEEVKTWLCAGDVVYIEIGTNQNYPRLLKQFDSDPEWNPWDRDGWRAMVQDGSDEEGDDSDSDSDDDSWGSSEDEDSSDDSDDTYSGNESDNFDDSSSGASGSSGSGGSWSDMERKAEEEDEENEGDESSEDERPRKKARTGNAPPPKRGGGMGRR